MTATTSRARLVAGDCAWARDIVRTLATRATNFVRRRGLIGFSVGGRRRVHQTMVAVIFQGSRRQFATRHRPMAHSAPVSGTAATLRFMAFMAASDNLFARALARGLMSRSVPVTEGVREQRQQC